MNRVQGKQIPRAQFDAETTTTLICAGERCGMIIGRLRSLEAPSVDIELRCKHCGAWNVFERSALTVYSRAS